MGAGEHQACFSTPDVAREFAQVYNQLNLEQCRRGCTGDCIIAVVDEEGGTIYDAGKDSVVQYPRR